jgi:hypothetical protein
MGGTTSEIRDEEQGIITAFERYVIRQMNHPFAFEGRFVRERSAVSVLRGVDALAVSSPLY